MNPSKQCLAAANQRTILNHNQSLFKRAQTGIFHGRIIRFGNNVPEMGNRTRRTWLPNIRSKRLKSDILDRTMKWHITTRALKTVKKYGSLDNYLLNVRTKWLGERSMWLRSRIQDELASRESQDQLSIENNRDISNQAKPGTVKAANGLKTPASSRTRPQVPKGRGIISELDLISERLAKNYPKSK